MVRLDAGATDADDSIDAGLVSSDVPLVSIDAAALDLAQDLPPCDTVVPPVEPSGTTDVTPKQEPGRGGCSCSLGRSASPKGVLLLGLLAFLLVRRKRAAGESNRSRD